MHMKIISSFVTVTLLLSGAHVCAMGKSKTTGKGIFDDRRVQVVTGAVGVGALAYYVHNKVSGRGKVAREDVEGKKAAAIQEDLALAQTVLSHIDINDLSSADIAALKNTAKSAKGLALTRTKTLQKRVDNADEAAAQEIERQDKEAEEQRKKRNAERARQLSVTMKAKDAEVIDKLNKALGISEDQTDRKDNGNQGKQKSDSSEFKSSK